MIEGEYESYLLFSNCCQYVRFNWDVIVAMRLKAVQNGAKVCIFLHKRHQCLTQKYSK